MDSTSLTLTANQGSQPQFGSLRVGIIDVATFDGVSKARLLLRPSTGDNACTLTEGDSITIPEHGVLTLIKVTTEGARSATLRFQASEPSEGE